MAVMAMCVLLSCTEKKEEATLSGLMKSNFVSEVQGKPTALYVLKNQNGAEACVTNWGGRLVSVMVPDKNQYQCDWCLKQIERRLYTKYHTHHCQYDQ